jgi:poly-beta-hydroxyalkanoate depolymerase
MRKFRFYTTSLMILSVLFIGLSSCKKCKIEGENVDAGEIRTDVAIYPLYGYITQDMGPDFHVHGNSAVANKFEMSTDNGFTRTPFNYSAYSILAYPMTLNCNHFLSREVTRDDDNMTATYKITVTQCKEAQCSQQRFLENYITVPAIPENYTILHDIQIIEQ